MAKKRKSRKSKRPSSREASSPNSNMGDFDMPPGLPHIFGNGVGNEVFLSFLEKMSQQIPDPLEASESELLAFAEKVWRSNSSSEDEEEEELDKELDEFDPLTDEQMIRDFVPDPNDIGSLYFAASTAATPAESRAYAERMLALAPEDTSALTILFMMAETRAESIQLLNRIFAAKAAKLGIDLNQPRPLRGVRAAEAKDLLSTLAMQADNLWELGRRPEAIEHLRRLVDLDPKDRLKMRWRLTPRLLTLGRYDEARSLMDGKNATSASYAEALLKFHFEGGSDDACEALRKAAAKNEPLAEMLAGVREPPDGSTDEEEDEYYFGKRVRRSKSEREAEDLVFDWLPAWRAVPGAIAWLRKELKLSPRQLDAELDDESELSGPEQFMRSLLEMAPDGMDVDELREQLDQVATAVTIRAKLSPADTDVLMLPQTENEVWEFDVRLMPEWVQDDGDVFLANSVLIASASDGLVVGTDILKRVTAEELERLLAACMMCPVVGSPRRPAVIRALPKPEFAELAAWAAKFSIEWRTVEQLEVVPACWQDIDEMGIGDNPEIPHLSRTPDVGEQQLRSLYEAAAEYYSRSPWNLSHRYLQIRIDCDSLFVKPWCACVLGNEGTYLGLVLYDDDAIIRDVLANKRLQFADVEQSLAIGFHLKSDCSPVDVVYALEHGLPVFNDDAWPEVIRFGKRGRPRPPRSRELTLLEGALRTVPLFCESDQSQSMELTPSVCGRKLRMKLTIVPAP